MPLTQESELPEKYYQTIKPWFDDKCKACFWTLQDGCEIHYRFVQHPEAKGTLVLSSGRVESVLKYAELIYDLYHEGYNIFIHDHRGQGQSSRECKNPHFGYIATFEQYVDDFESMIDDVLLPKLSGNDTAESASPVVGLPIFLVCHSMGSAIGALLLKRRPQFFAKAVLCSPMFGITPPLPAWAAHALVYIGVRYNRLLGRQASYFFGQTDYAPSAFYKNRLMSSEVRYRLFRELYADKPQLQLGGVTFEWLHASLKGMAEIRAHAHKLTTPCKVLYSGADTVVANKDIEQVIADMPNCESACIPEAMHELFFEKDKFRKPALEKLLDYLAR
jgi:lysophospholipase